MSEHVLKRSYRKLSGAVVATLVTMTLLVPGTAFAAPTSADKQAEAEAALNSLNTMQATLNKASDDYFTAVDEQQKAQKSMDDSQARIDQASGQIASLQDKLGTRANSMYRNGNTTFLDILLGASSFEEFATNLDLLNRLNENDAEMVQQTKDLRAEVEEQKQEYARQEKIAADKAAEAKEVKDQAEGTVASMQALYDSLSAEAAQLLEQERAAQAAAEAAAAQSVIDAANQAATASQASNTGGSGGSGSSDTGSGGGDGTSGGSGGSSFTPSYSPVTGNAIVDRAYSCMGAPYSWGACGPGSFDCSGLVSYAISGSYSRLGTTYTFLGWSRVSDPQPGDVAVNEGHCGIYIGGGQMIHAATYGVGVIIGPVQSGMVFVRP